MTDHRVRISTAVLIILVVFLFNLSCKKEYSYEGKDAGVQSDSIDCSSISVHGVYSAYRSFTDTDFITCDITLSQPGNIHAFTDTVNGFYFANDAESQSAGPHRVVLKAYGRRQASQTTNFTLHVNGSICSFSIQQAEANFEFLTIGGSCDGNKSYGVYKAGHSLTEADSVQVKVNVGSPGSFVIQTPIINGISFSTSGVFSNTGIQTVSLVGEGTPLTGGNFEFPITTSHSACSFFIATEFKTPDPSMYYSFDADGHHYHGFLDSAGKSIVVTAAGNINVLSLGTIITGSNDTLINTKLSRINAEIVAGIYHSAVISDEDYACGLDFSDKHGTIYTSSNNLPAFEIKLLYYGKPGELVKGEFSGPVLNDQGVSTNVTEGVFQTYLSN